MNLGLPEVLFAVVVIGVPLWVARRFPISKRVARFAIPCALAVLVALLVFNWATVFRP